MMIDTKPVISWELCLQLANDNAELATDLLKMFVDELSDAVTEMQALYDKKEWNSLKNRVHKLHGGACYTGVPHLKTAAKNLEEALRNESSEEELNELFNQLLSQIQLVQSEYTEGSFA